MTVDGAPGSEPEFISIDIETTGLTTKDEIVSAAVCTYGKQAFHTHSFWIDRFHDYSKEADDRFRAILHETLFSPSFKGTVIFHNLDFDLKFILDRYCPDSTLSLPFLCNLMDTLMLSRVARNNKYVAHTDPKKLKCHSLKYLALEHLGVEHASFDEVVDQGNIRFADRSEVLAYNEKDAELTLKLFLRFREVLDPSEWRYAVEIEMPHLLSLLQMNRAGLPFDQAQAESLLQSLTTFTETLQKQLFRAVGKVFNIRAPREVAAAIFYNPKVSYFSEDGSRSVVKPLLVTEKGQPKVDTDTLIRLRANIAKEDPSSNAIQVIGWLMQLLEAAQTLGKLEPLLEHARAEVSDPVLYPNFSASAKSGRVKSSRPNLLGIPKKAFKKSSQEAPVELRDASVRHLMVAPQGYKIVSIDVSALDLSVVTYGAKNINPNFPWAQFFKSSHKIDIHLTVASHVRPDELRNALAGLPGVPENFCDYLFSKPEKTHLDVVHLRTQEVTRIHYPADRAEGIASAVSVFRKTMKEVNLSSSYMIGANQLALNIEKNAGYDCGYDEAEHRLDQFYSSFPEIREFQNQVCNAVYADGYFTSPFGRRFYPDCYDELNEFYRAGNGRYEFILEAQSRFWWVEADRWHKYSLPVLEAGVVTEKPFGFIFERIHHCLELDARIFKKKQKAPSKFQRNSESSAEDMAPYALTRIALTNEIVHAISFGKSLSADAEALIGSFISEGKYLIPQKMIALYRVTTGSPSSRFFRVYKKLEQVSRKFFPLYCQGVANSLAIQALTFVREEIARRKLDARILIFVHDQIDVLTATESVDQVESILEEALRCPMPPFDIPLSGKVEILDHIRAD